MRIWGKKNSPEPKVEAPGVGITTQPVVIDPSISENLKFAAYRADAIARDVEQRLDEGRDQNVDHDKMVSEALAYGHILVGASRWTREELEKFQTRLRWR